jgi:hypothetical protein
MIKNERNAPELTANPENQRIYDQKIRPLLKQIAAISDEHNFAYMFSCDLTVVTEKFKDGETRVGAICGEHHKHQNGTSPFDGIVAMQQASGGLELATKLSKLVDATMEVIHADELSSLFQTTPDRKEMN